MMLQIGVHSLRTSGPNKRRSRENMLSFKYLKNCSSPGKAELFCVAQEYRILERYLETDFWLSIEIHSLLPHAPLPITGLQPWLSVQILNFHNQKCPSPRNPMSAIFWVQYNFLSGEKESGSKMSICLIYCCNIMMSFGSSKQSNLHLAISVCLSHTANF